GRNAAHAGTLREQWKLADTGIVDARVQVQFPVSAATNESRPDTFMAGLRDFDHAYPRLVRHTAILTGAGHASADDEVQGRLAGSALAWADAAHRSYGLGGQVLSSMQSVDAAWQRPAPTRD